MSKIIKGVIIFLITLPILIGGVLTEYLQGLLANSFPAFSESIMVTLMGTFIIAGIIYYLAIRKLVDWVLNLI